MRKKALKRLDVKAWAVVEGDDNWITEISMVRLSPLRGTLGCRVIPVRVTEIVPRGKPRATGRIVRVRVTEARRGR